MSEELLSEIRNYLKENGARFGIRDTDFDTLVLSKVGQYKRMRMDKSVYIVFARKIPLLVIKFFTDEYGKGSLLKETENILKIRQMGFSDLTPQPTIALIRGREVIIENYLQGVTIQEVFKQTPFMTPLFLERFSEKIFTLIGAIHKRLNSTAQKVSKVELENDVNKLILDYSYAFPSTNPEEIKNLVAPFIENYPEDEIAKRIVLFDAYPCNILFNIKVKKAYLIDLEYMGYSTLNFLEPIRAAFFFLKYSYEYTNINIFINTNNFNDAFFKGKGRLGKFLRTFLNNNCVIGKAADYNFQRGIMLIFFMTEALLQNNTIPSQTNDESTYAQFVDTLISSNSEGRLLSTLKKSRIIVRKSLARKALGYIERGEVKKMFRMFRERFMRRAEIG